MLLTSHDKFPFLLFLCTWTKLKLLVTPVLDTVILQTDIGGVRMSVKTHSDFCS